MSSKLLTEGEVAHERVYEIRIVDLRTTKDAKQRSFSLYVRKGTKSDDYASVDTLKTAIESYIKAASI